MVSRSDKVKNTKPMVFFTDLSHNWFIMSETALQEPLGESEVFLTFQQRLGRAARVDRPVLIIGERGTGKELAASRLHYLSKRWNAPLVALNCSALSPGLIEAELFGHEEGAFTGATASRKGRFEEAAGGTLFLDEIGLIPLEVQEKILRVVEYGTFQRVGSSHTVEVEVRIVGATNSDLPALCEQGRFKRDLLDRLSFEVLYVPPLRVRGSDIDLLARHFAVRMSRELDREAVPEFSPEVRERMRSYPWPGNIRELKNAVERAVYRDDAAVIENLALDPFENPWEAPDTPAEAPEILFPDDLRGALNEMERRWLTVALEQANGHQGRAADSLGLSYDQFRGLYRKHVSE